MTRFAVPVSLLTMGLLVLAPPPAGAGDPASEPEPAEAGGADAGEGAEPDGITEEQRREAAEKAEAERRRKAEAERWAAEKARRERAAKRIETMADSLRETFRSGERRIDNTAREMAGVGEDAVVPLIELLTDSAAAVRLAAVKALSVLRPRDALAPLVARLGDGDVRIVLAAVEALDGYDADLAARALARWLGHPDPRVREAVMAALDPERADTIRPVLRSHIDSPPPVVGAGPFLEALGRFPDRATRGDLFDALDDPDLAPHALRGIAHLGPDSARPLARWLADHPDAPVAAHAAEILVRWGDEGIRRLEGVLRHLSVEVKRGAVRAWIDPGSEGAAERATALIGHDDAGVRIAALEIVPDVEGADPTHRLRDNLRHRDDRVPMLTARAVRDVGRDADVEAAIIDRYREVARRRTAEDAAIRSELLLTLGHVGGAAAVPELVQAIGHDDEVEAAMSALGHIGEPALGSLLFVIKTGDPVRTPMAVRALGHAGEVAVEPLLDLLVHRRRDVRNTARQALAEMGVMEAVPRVLELIRDPETPGRVQLVALLGALYGDRSFQALERLALEGTEQSLRRGAVGVLAQAADPRVLAVLRRVAKDDDDTDVRHLAVKGLVWQGDHDSVPLLLELLRYEKVPIQMTIARGLGYLARPRHIPEIVSTMSTPRDEVLTALRECLRRIAFRPDLDEGEEFEDWLKRWEDRDRGLSRVKGAEMTLGDGTVLHYALGGEGRPLLVLHGGPDLSYDYLRPHVDRFEEDRLVILVDLPGRGRSSGPTAPGSHLGLEHDVRSLATMLVRLNLSGIDVYAHGWGAMVAARLAEAHDGLVRRMVLDNSPMPTVAGWTGRIDAAAAAVPEPWSLDLPVFERDARRFQPEVRDAFLARALMTGAVHRPRVLVDVAPRLRTRPRIRATILGGMGAFDLRGTYAGLDVPTLLLYGEHTPLPEATVAWREGLAEDNDAVSLKLIGGAGYLPAHEQSRRWYDAVSRFLRSD